MSILGIEHRSDKGSRKSRSRKNLIGLAVLALGSVLLIRGTLAASINLNDSAPVEFGQGIALATSCAGNTALTVTPQANFVNSVGSGVFKFTSVTVANIPTDCYGKQFKIIARSSSDGSALALFDTNDTEIIVNNYAGSYLTTLSGLTIETISNSAFTATFDIPVANAADVEVLTIESTNAPEILTVGSLEITEDYGGIEATPEITGPGTGPYTVEGWYKFTQAPSSSNALLAQSSGLSFFINPALNTVRLQEWGGGWRNGPTFTITGITLNNWIHLAISRNSSGDTAIWIDGIRMGITTDSLGYEFLPSKFPGGPGAGEAFMGKISNIRVTNTSVYNPTSTTITVPPGPLEPIAGTKLLLPFYSFDVNRDLSDDNRTVTSTGLASSDSPFGLF
jgi:hypothetical protein